MTPAIELLKHHKINHKLHSYQHDPSCTDFGQEAITKLQLDGSQVFKTLLIAQNADNKKLAVMLIPVIKQLNLKAAAQALGCKKITMADKAIAEKITGYLLGGISPLGQKRQLVTCLDSTANEFSSIYISAGKRGLDIELDPVDLIRLTNATILNLT